MKSIQIKCTGTTAVDIENLEEFQGELKSLSKENFEKLKKEIIENGFSFPVNVWKNDGKYYILDGHQRTRTIRKMMEQGWKCPPLPVSFVEADTREQAKHKLLAAASQYGKVESQGLYEFVMEADMLPTVLEESFAFPEVDIPKFLEENFDLAARPNGLGQDIEQAEAKPTELTRCPSCGAEFGINN